jgi:hypothetical protein
MRIVDPNETATPTPIEKPDEYNVKVQICCRDFDEYINLWVTEGGADKLRREATDPRNAFIFIQFWRMEPPRFVHTDDGLEPLESEWIHGDKLIRTGGIISIDFLD